MVFEEAYKKFWNELGASKKMVLSTSYENIVTSRMMSIIILNENLYFQTDKTFRKYNQLKRNNHAALCADNIQIEGVCSDLGHPSANTAFCDAYQKFFTSSYHRYTSLENERLFQFTPTFIERWIYLDNIPYIETFDIVNQKYMLEKYTGV